MNPEDNNTITAIYENYYPGVVQIEGTNLYTVQLSETKILGNEFKTYAEAEAVKEQCIGKKIPTIKTWKIEWRVLI